jgi:hypothetical protein
MQNIVMPPTIRIVEDSLETTHALGKLVTQL